MLTLALAGCASSLDLGRATTLAPGQTRLSAGMQSTLVSPALSPQTDTRIPWVQAAVGWHHGLRDGVEAGARLWGMGWPGLFTTVGGAADAKVQLVRGPVDLALAPTALYYRPSIGGAPWHIGSAQTALLVGVNFGRDQLVLSPRAAGWVWGGYGQVPQAAASAGLGVGVAVPVGLFELMPELVYGWSPIGFDGEVAAQGKRGLGAVELGVTLSRTRPP